MSDETYEKQMSDSDIIFTAVSNSADNMEEANRMVVMAYVMDMEFSRAGISHALKRLENHYRQGEDNVSD